MMDISSNHYSAMVRACAVIITDPFRVRSHYSQAFHFHLKNWQLFVINYQKPSAARITVHCKDTFTAAMHSWGSQARGSSVHTPTVHFHLKNWQLFVINYQKRQQELQDRTPLQQLCIAKQGGALFIRPLSTSLRGSSLHLQLN
jgi:hypothetical protein